MWHFVRKSGPLCHEVRVMTQQHRSINDIPYYDSVETSHLHDFGQKTERTRFLEKIQRLDAESEMKAKLVDNHHKAVERPKDWKPVSLPNKIRRSKVPKLLFLGLNHNISH